MSVTPNSIEARDIAYHFPSLVDLHRHEEAGSMVIDHGEGIYVFDNNGKRYIEGLAGLWSVAVGFGERRLAEAAFRQMQKLPYYHNFNYHTHAPVVDLAEKLISLAPVPMKKVHFTSSGSEANDLIAKMVWFRSNALGKPEKKKIISRVNAYHGVTIGSGSLTGISHNHECFDLPLPQMRHTSTPDYPRLHREGESELEFSRRMAADLEAMILAEGPETVAAFIGEPVMGAGGVIVPPSGYWDEIQKVLRKYDILLIADEVICGFGRTGNWFGCTTYGIEPDVMTVSKQLSSSYLPISAIMVNEKFYAPIADASHRLGAFFHGYTASGHPVATAVALENLKIIEERDLVGNAARLSPLFLGRLKGLAEHKLASFARGVGLIGALELKPWDKPGRAAKAAADALVEEGVICRNIGEALCFCPPLIISADQINEMFDAVGRALDRIGGEQG